MDYSKKRKLTYRE